MIGSSKLRQTLANLVGVAALIAIAGTPQTAYAQTGAPYTFTTIQYPGAVFTDAVSLNNAGQITGIYEDTGGQLHGFLLSGGVYTSVDVPGAAITYALGIGVAGEIVGTWSPGPFGPYHAFVLDQGVFTSFDYPFMETDARAINSSGQIVGVYNTGGLTTPHGFIKTGNSFVEIDFPGAAGTEPWGINDAGVVSGYYYDATGIHGFTYFNGTYSAINFPASTATRMTRVNNLNQVVGWNHQGSITHGFVVTGASFRAVNVDGAASTGIFDINDAGHLVGSYDGPACPAGCGFLATPRLGPPPCDQQVALGYSPNLLTMSFTNLTTSIPTVWSTYLFLHNTGTLVPVWSIPIPAILAPASFSVPLPGVPQVGNVTGISLLSSAGSIQCADFGSVNTGP